MKLAIGNSYFRSYLQRDKEINQLYIIYKRFFDSKGALLEGDYREYLRQLWLNRHQIEYAIYPDYVRHELPLPKGIKYIYVIHEFEKDVPAFFRLREKFYLIAGYASDNKYRDYSMYQFITTFKNVEKWYLGVSTKHEIVEAIRHGFDYADITFMALGNFMSIRKYEDARKRLIEFYNYVKKLENMKNNTISLTKFISE